LNNIINLHDATQAMDTNPIKTAITVCSELIQRQVSRKKRKNATSTDEKFTDSGEKIV